MDNESSAENIPVEEVQDISTPSSREVRTQMPHRISPMLTEEDRIYLQKYRNNQDIKYSLISQFIALIRKQPEYARKKHFTQAFQIVVNSGIFLNEKAEEDNTTIKEKE